MIEEIHVEDEPNEERIKAIQRACSIFLDVARYNPESAPRGEQDIDEIVNEILRRNLDLADPVSYSIAWHAILEARRETTQREAEREAREEAHQREIDEFKRPSADDLPALRDEMKSRQPQSPSPAPADLSHLSQAEFDAIPDVELRRMFGAVRVEDRQGRGNGRTVKEERNALILADKVVNRAGVRRTKTIRFSQEELQAQEERARAIAKDKAERHRLEQEWRKK
jgi:ribosomal protein L12E/L44/L45/RPP1/RPP2